MRAQTVAAAVGFLFLIVGILGFVPGVTTNYDGLAFAGHNSHAQLFGVFDTSVLHNIVHLLFGAAGLTLARTAESAVDYLSGGGLVYLALFLGGTIFGADDTAANWIPVNWADNLLHLGLGVGMIGAALLVAQAPHQKEAPITT